MPNIQNSTVATGSGLSTASNGGRKLVRLSNGAIISGYYNSSTSKNVYSKSLDNGNTWTATSNTLGGSTTAGFALATNGTNVYSLYGYGNGGIYFVKVDVNSSNLAIDGQAVLLDSQSSAQAVSLAINDAGTELHAAWSSKNSTYPNSFNIRYAKGTIAADGSVTWGAVLQVSTLNSSSQNTNNPSVSFNKNGEAVIFSEWNINATNMYILALKQTGLANVAAGSLNWSYSYVSASSNSYLQVAPSAIFVPQSINGLANGRIWVAWHGKDATDSAKFNVHTSYSDDGGVTWATPTKQTTGNTYDQMNASLTADSQGKVLLTWDAQNATTTQTALKVFNGTWGATTTLTGDGYTNVATLFDNTFKLGMTTPPLIRQSTSGVYFSGNYFTGASVTPASSALGDKTASSVLSYTVTPESGSTVTSIVEKVNGTTVNTYSNPASLSRTFTIPQSTWDNLKYYNTHTISVTVTDSNGMANTQVYSFNKTLANDASLLEGAKASKDGKDRISTKRDVLAGQVGLAAGSTFDAISAQLASGTVFMKFANGTATANSASPYNITVTGLSFRPKVVLWTNLSINTFGTWIDPSLTGATDKKFVARASITANNTSYPGTDAEAIINSNGFTLATYQPGSYSYNWIAFG